MKIIFRKDAEKTAEAITQSVIILFKQKGINLKYAQIEKFKQGVLKALI